MLVFKVTPELVPAV